LNKKLRTAGENIKEEELEKRWSKELCFSETGEMSSDVAQQVAYTQ
jgi:hypothetical protein